MRFSLKKLVLYVSVYLLLGISNLLIKLVSFKSLVRLISNTSTEIWPVLSPQTLARLKFIGKVIPRVSKHTPWRSKCFEQALTASFILKRLGISHVVKFGLNNDNKALNAHAWLLVNNIVITGQNVNMDFTAVTAFYYTSKKDRVLYV